MTAEDARVKVTLPDHPKTKKLIRRCGQAGAWNLIRLFLFATANRPDGNLSGMDSDDIEIAADWQGDPGAFVAALVDVRFLVGEPGAFSINDWADHNPWAAGSERRSDKAKFNALKRHHGEKYAIDSMPEYAASIGAVPKNNASGNQDDCKQHATSMTPACDQHASSNAAPESSNAPSPSPSPSKSEDQEQKHERVPRSLCRFDEFWQAYPNKKGRKDAEATWKRKGLDAIADLILADVQQRKQRDRDWLSGFPPHGSTYVNAEGWRDGLPPVPLPNAGAPPRHQPKQVQGLHAIMGIPNEAHQSADLVLDLDPRGTGPDVHPEPRRLACGSNGRRDDGDVDRRPLARPPVRMGRRGR